jgi:hypothetical protein
VTDCGAGRYAVSAPRLQECAAAPCVPPRRQLQLVAGLLSPTLWFKCVGRSVWLLWIERRSGRDWKTGASPGNEEPCWLSGRQGSRKIDDLCEILNYLLASLIMSSFAELGRVLVAWTPNPKPGFPMRRNIPAQRNHAVACKCIEYVLSEVIGNEGDSWYARDLRWSIAKFGIFRHSYLRAREAGTNPN